MKTAPSIALLACFLSNASSFAPVTTSFRPPQSAFVPADAKQRLLTRALAAGLDDENQAVMERKASSSSSQAYLASLDTKEETTKSSIAVQEEEEMPESQNLMQKIKDAGTAGILSYMVWEFAFWFASVPVVLFGYYSVMGHFPDFSNQEDMAKLGAEAFAFVNLARFAVPLRIGLALGTTPWMEENVVQRFFKKEEQKDDESVENYDPAKKMLEQQNESFQ